MLKWLMYTAIAILVFAAGNWWFYGQRSVESTIVLAPVVPPDLVQVLAVDLDADRNIDQSTVLAGQDIILAIKNPDPLAKPLYTVITNIDVLHALDTNKDNRIDAIDPAYSSLYAVLFTDNGKNKIVSSFKQAGIVAIILEKSSSTADDIVGYVVMADSSNRLIHRIFIDSQYIK